MILKPHCGVGSLLGHGATPPLEIAANGLLVGLKFQFVVLYMFFMFAIL